MDLRDLFKKKPEDEESEPDQVKKPEETSGISLTESTLVALMREARKESPEIEAEKELARKRAENAKNNLRAEIERAAETKRRNQEACSHRKYDLYGRDVGSAIQGQKHSDGLYHGLCVHCFKEFDPEPSASHPQAGGVTTGASY